MSKLRLETGVMIIGEKLFFFVRMKDSTVADMLPGVVPFALHRGMNAAKSSQMSIPHWCPLEDFCEYDKRKG